MLTLRVEIEKLRETVCAAMAGQREELQQMVYDQLEAELQTENVHQLIEQSVRTLVESAIKDLTDNYRVKSAVQDLLADQLCAAITSKETR